MEEKAILLQALVNYKELWADFKSEIDDGSWNRTEVEKNIADLEELINNI